MEKSINFASKIGSLSILILDNYDSFTYNLVHQVEQFTDEFEVFRNDAISVQEANRFDKILLSPGPGLPKDAGVMSELLKTYSSSKSVLGICLGMQGIAETFGAELFNMPQVLHGVITNCKVLDRSELLYNDVPDAFEIGHYHSWAVDQKSMPNELITTAVDSNGTIMSIRHRDYDVRGVQFHPESVMTPNGLQMIRNWIEG